MALIIKESGDFHRVESYLSRLARNDLGRFLNRYGMEGANALSRATPVESGETSEGWYYTIEAGRGYYSIRWHNRHVIRGVNIAVLIQYGHGTRNGGYVQGRDYIMPAMRPLFDRIAAEVWEEVTKA